MKIEATCSTEGCGNAGIPVELELDEMMPVLCGPCGQLIDDVKEKA